MGVREKKTRCGSTLPRDQRMEKYSYQTCIGDMDQIAMSLLCAYKLLLKGKIQQEQLEYIYIFN